MRIEQLEGQCGIMVLSGLSINPEDNLRVIINSHAFETDEDICDCTCSGCDDHDDKTELRANIMWTDVARARGALSSGEKLKRHITEKKFGTVKTMGPILNPNTKNKITVYVWTPNKKFMKSNYF